MKLKEPHMLFEVNMSCGPGRFINFIPVITLTTDHSPDSIN